MKSPDSVPSSPVPGSPAKPIGSRPLREDITRRAQELWRGYGCPSGRDEEIWLEAERQVIGTDSEVVDSGNGAVSADDVRDVTATSDTLGTPGGRAEGLREKPDRGRRTTGQTKAPDPSAGPPRGARRGRV